MAVLFAQWRKAPRMQTHGKLCPMGLRRARQCARAHIVKAACEGRRLAARAKAQMDRWAFALRCVVRGAECTLYDGCPY